MESSSATFLFLYLFPTISPQISNFLLSLFDPQNTNIKPLTSTQAPYTAKPVPAPEA
jgi:hypothetical protein